MKRRALACFIAGLLQVTTAHASTGGISGVSGRDGGPFCAMCHTGGVEPSVTLEGPTSVIAGALVSYTFTIEGGQGIAGGLDIAASQGVLSVHSAEVATTRLLNDELTHIMPKETEGDASVTWQFDWRAPSNTGDAVLWAAGNSVDLSESSTGDSAAMVSLTIHVEQCPDSDGDGFLSSACSDLGDVGGGDCNDDDEAVVPGGVEVCGDGVDNNCDESIDEWCEPCTVGETRQCYGGPDESLAGIGACNFGLDECVTGLWSGQCFGSGLPSEELCNDVDDDCDGITDGIARVCYSGSDATRSVGLCRDGHEICEAGAWLGCEEEVIATDEACNDEDDDCDGSIDEDCICDLGEVRPCYTGPVGTANRGVCHSGFQACNQGLSWGECTGDRRPEEEICGDGIDQDCDGRDENCLLGETGPSCVASEAEPHPFAWFWLILGTFVALVCRKCTTEPV